MMNVAQLATSLEIAPEHNVVEGVTLNTYRGKRDAEAWVAVRNRAFSRLRVGVRAWNMEDFENEFLHKWWWNPQHMWFAHCDRAVAADGSCIGTVTLAFRGPPEAAVPVVHWLAVVPEWRRRGVGRLLMATLERYCWDRGLREIRLETHREWTAALALYAALGYRPVH